MDNYDVKKIANALIFFIDSDVKRLGITKLMKLFFYTDKYHLEAYGKPIFNHTYQKLPKGPVPTWLYSIIRTAISGSSDYDFEYEVDVFNQYIEVEEIDTGNYRHINFLKKQEFDSNFFSKSQLKILQKVADEFKFITAKSISEQSHQTRAWQSAKDNEIISYASMVEDSSVSNYINYIQNEKNSFTESVYKHLERKVC